MTRPTHCAHCRRDQHCFAPTRRGGHLKHSNTAHHFDPRYKRVCSGCMAQSEATQTNRATSAPQTTTEAHDGNAAERN